MGPGWSRGRRPSEPTSTGDEALEHYLVTAAQALAEAGSYLAAVDLLMTMPSDLRSADIEAQLVELRHAAYVHRPQPEPAPADWPPRVPDIFRGVETAPEVAGADLTVEALRGGIQHHGCLVVRELVDGPTIVRLLEDVHAAFEQRDAWRRNVEEWDRRLRGASSPEAPRPGGSLRVQDQKDDPQPDPDFAGLPTTCLSWDSPWFRPFAPQRELIGPNLMKNRFSLTSRLMVADSPRMAYDVVQTLDSSGVREVIGRYLGERPAFSMPKSAVTRQSFEQAGVGWHQEAVVFKKPHIRAVNVWLALSDCGEESPGLSIVPRRLERVLEVEPEEHPLSLSKTSIERVSAGTPPSTPAFNAGDAVFFDEMLLHRTSFGPRMSRDRYNLEFWMFSPSHAPDRMGLMML